MSGDICDEYAAKDDRIHVVHKQNGGVSSARNRGIDIAKGDYIGFVDPDDTIESTMYSELFRAIKHSKADIVICPIRIINLRNETTTITPIWNNQTGVIDENTIREDIIPSIIDNNNYSIASSVNKLYKKSLFNTDELIRFDEDKDHSEDARLNFRLITIVNSLVYINSPLYNYYIRNRDSLTNIFMPNFHENILDNKNFLIKLCKEYNKEDKIANVRDYFTGVTLNYMHKVIMNNDLTKHDKYKVLKSIMENDEFVSDISVYNCPSHFYKILKILCIKRRTKAFMKLIRLKMTIKLIY
ncbi:glycosyltransferase involved in cell wall biosynthesis [Virgibacillus litoralis]|uniref:Glycosyltransferase involved in cell wall biosynthesis n=2 Tax=Virgibacillus litoralis TaxID=578221 RepID=A0ABS4HDW6_9BACI|nr:glycosyltransferase involved in cell wall biosynthesis [Virgibacillus litoralis]